MIHRLPALLAALVALGVATEAAARVGGGESFGTGGGGGGGGGSYGGGSSGGGDGGDIGYLIYLWIRFCIAYPQIGIPVTLLGVAAFGVRAVWSKFGRSHEVYRGRKGGKGVRDESALVVDTGGPARGNAAIEKLKQTDPGFSLPVLQEFLALVHRRALEAACTGAWDPLAPFVDEGVRSKLAKILDGVKEVHEVVHAGLLVGDAQVRSDATRLFVTFLTSRREVSTRGDARVYVEERWVFRRAAGAASLPPEEMLRMGCPSCGAAVETDRMGQCTQCGTAITKGQLQWQAIEVDQTVRRPLDPPKVSWAKGGDEPSLRPATRHAADLGTEWRKFTARHPDFSLPGFKDHAKDVFLELQSAWSDGEWSRARPYCTEPLFQTLRFYMEQYGEAGLKNRLDDVALDQIEIVRVDQDAWYDAITIRLWASMRDWVEDGDGKVVGGNDKVSRRFSEYWTFLRATGTGAASKDIHRCPSCAAPLDRVSAAGVCGYCDTKITSGRFDWVLSRIDQVETYRG